MGGGASFACGESRARGTTSRNASTNATTARGFGATAGGVEGLGAASAPRQSDELEELRTKLAEVTAERDDYAATVDEFIKDHKRWQQRALTPEKRDRILNALGVGKQSPQYKRVKVELDKLM